MKTFPLLCLAGLFAAVTPPTLAAQVVATDQPPVDCLWFRGDTNKVINRPLRAGYRLIITPRPRAEYRCRLQIVDAKRRVRFSFSGYSASLVDLASDLDNDGDADVLLEIDVGGGNHCCRVLHAITLDGTPHELWRAGPYPVSVERYDIGTVLHFAYAFYNLGAGGADAPIFERILRPSAKGMTDVTSRFCDVLVAPDSTAARWGRWEITPEDRRRLLSTPPGGALPLEVRHTLAYFYTVAMQDVICGKIVHAAELIRSAIPEWLQPEVRGNVWKAVRSVIPAAVTLIETWRPTPSE